MPLASGTRLGTYQIVAPLSAGGMGEVYRAKDLRLGREIALKVLPAGMVANPERLARFEREAQALARLNHPNIVTLFSVEEIDHVHFLTMELVEGQSLDHSIVPSGLPVRRIVELGIALADALVAAHEKGMVHRDLKPANVMLMTDGRVKVLDFGLAKLGAAPSSDPNVTQTVATPTLLLSVEGQIVGTVPYMSPEQIRGGAVDPRTDLFALGVVLYELASGKRPFGGETHVDVSHAILREEPRPLASLRSDLPEYLDHIVNRCLEKNPRERYQSALDISKDLRRLREGLERGEPWPPVSPRPTQVASIAVLPFVNRSANAEDQYFSDGLADELLNLLSKDQGLRVTARSSSSQFKGEKSDTAALGRKLNVATLLEGGVRKAGNRIRVAVQLVNVADSSHLWSEIYDRTLEDIFAVQDDIAQSVVKELRTTLLGEASDSHATKADVAQAARGRATDPEAYRLYLLARHLLDRHTADDTEQAIAYLREALARDPAFALAWAELGRTYVRKASRGWVSVGEGYGRAREAVERALALEPELAEGHARMGWIQMVFDWDFRGAEASAARALELAPGSANALRTAGVLAGMLGRVEVATELVRRSLELDPLSPSSYHDLGNALHASNRFAEAEAAYRKALVLDPRWSVTHATLSLTLLVQGRSEEALAEATREQEANLRLWALSIVHHVLGDRAASNAALQELIERFAEESPFQIAEVYAARNEVEKAFEWLARAYIQRDTGLTTIKSSNPLRSIHHDPRWRTLLTKLRLEG